MGPTRRSIYFLYAGIAAYGDSAGSSSPLRHTTFLRNIAAVFLTFQTRNEIAETATRKYSVSISPSLSLFLCVSEEEDISSPSPPLLSPSQISTVRSHIVRPLFNRRLSTTASLISLCWTTSNKWTGFEPASRYTPSRGPARHLRRRRRLTTGRLRRPGSPP